MPRPPKKSPKDQPSLPTMPRPPEQSELPVVVPAAPAHVKPRFEPLDLNVTVEVQPRQPRLAWHGVQNKEVATKVPTQVVEIVRPGRALEVAGLAPKRVAGRTEEALPQNRLIWTNDNLVALQTLLDEQDTETGDWKYRGKVDLVYIDPPFMVNSDFVADNTVDIDFDDDGLEVPVRKEPSLVEILAYKDTWRQGLDSFLSTRPIHRLRSAKGGMKREPRRMERILLGLAPRDWRRHG